MLSRSSEMQALSLTLNSLGPVGPVIFGAVLLVLVRLQHGGIGQCVSGESLP